MSVKKKALFICLGNICRSPIAEGVYNKTLRDLSLADSWEVDSAGLSDSHVGQRPHWRSVATMRRHGIRYTKTARQIVDEDFHHYDYIFGMDEHNMKELNEKAPKGSKAKLLLFGDFDPTGDRIIRDPYYDSSTANFEKCYQQCSRAARGFLDKHGT